MKASIIIPTKNRWEKLQKTLKAIKENTSVSHEVIIIFDGDVENFKKYGKRKPKNYKIVCNTQSREYFHCINQGCYLASGDYIVYLADDIRPMKNWLKHAIGIFEKHFKDGLGLVALRTDLGEGLTHAPHGMVSRKLVAMNGYLFPPAYLHYFGDTELGLRMQEIKRYVPTEKAVLFHDKPAKDKKFIDKTYSESWQRCWKSDELQFHLRNPKFVTAMILATPNILDKVVQTQLWAKPNRYYQEKEK